MQMMTLMSICIKMVCVRCSWWFSIRISVLVHLLCRAETLRQEDGEIPWGAENHDEGNVHLTVLRLGSELGWRHGLVMPALSFICPLESHAWPTHYSCLERQRPPST